MITEQFKFSPISLKEIEDLNSQIDNFSSPGTTGIPVKIIKFCSYELGLILSLFFNNCINSGSVPDEFKFAVVSPLYKGKGNLDAMDNYRAISVLPPLAKVFERTLSVRIVNNFESNKIFSTDQLGKSHL